MSFVYQFSNLMIIGFENSSSVSMLSFFMIHPEVKLFYRQARIHFLYKIMLVHVWRLGIHLQLVLNKIFAISTHFLSQKDCQSSIVQSWFVQTIFLTSPLLTLHLLTNAWFPYILDAVPQDWQYFRNMQCSLLPSSKIKTLFKFQSLERDSCR